MRTSPDSPFAILLAAVLLLILTGPCFGAARDLDAVKKAGVLRHLGIPYANFVTGQGDGLDVDLMKRFAKHLGVRYAFVATDWPTLWGDLTGKRIRLHAGKVSITGEAPIKGDVIASGLTILPWRKEIVAFSTPTFPTQVWLVVKADSKVAPIKPTGNTEADIKETRAALHDLKLLSKAGTCLDPALFHLEATGAVAKLFPGNLNDLAPAVIMGEADATLLDVPDALVALHKYPRKIKIIGPMTNTQEMAVAFAKDQPRLRRAFDDFFAELVKSGEYDTMVRQYYPLVFQYLPGFFKR